MCFHCQLSAAEKSKTLELFTMRRNEYRIAALTCKKHGDIQQAKQFLAVSKVKEGTIITLFLNSYCEFFLHSL